MKNIELPIGNGQEIYIDPDDLYINSKWIDQELNTIIMPDIPSSQSNPVYETYKDLFKYLYKIEYKIITDSRLASETTFFFSPCLDKHINNTKEEYKWKKDHKIYSLLSNEEIVPPLTISFPVILFRLLFLLYHLF